MTVEIYNGAVVLQGYQQSYTLTPAQAVEFAAQVKDAANMIKAGMVDG